MSSDNPETAIDKNGNPDRMAEARRLLGGIALYPAIECKDTELAQFKQDFVDGVAGKLRPPCKPKSHNSR